MQANLRQIAGMITVLTLLAAPGTAGAVAVLPSSQQHVKLVSPEYGVVVGSGPTACRIYPNTEGQSDFKGIVRRAGSDGSVDAVQVIHVNFQDHGKDCSLFFGRVVEPGQDAQSFELLGSPRMANNSVVVDAPKSGEIDEDISTATLNFAQNPNSEANPDVHVTIVDAQ